MQRVAHADFFYVQPADVRDEHLFIVGQEWHHLWGVHRARPGHRFFAVDGVGHCFECELLRAERGKGVAKILQRFERFGEPRLQVTVAASPLRGQSFGLLVEKCTELGVSRFIPVCSTRTQPFAPERVQRWRRVALAAMKQCGRSVLPEVAEPVPLAKVVGTFSSAAVRLVAHEGEGTSLAHLLTDLERQHIFEVVVLVGPEGGFTPEEVQAAAQGGFTLVNLGERRLRAETAAIVASALVLALCDSPR